MSHLYLLFTESEYARPEGGRNEKLTCKIGLTNNPKSRFDQLQTGMPETLMAHAWKLNDPKIMEEFLHLIYKPHRVNGEWFNLLWEDYDRLVPLLCSISLYCRCDACNGRYDISRVAQKQIDNVRVEMGGEGSRRWGA